MGRGRKRRQRNKKANRLQKQADRAPYITATERRITLGLTPLDVELAAAHDGFLRGGIEVRFVVSVIVVRPDGTALTVARQLWQKDADNNGVPQTLEVRAQPAIDQVFTVPYGSSIAALVAAYEEDGGTDVDRAYADIEKSNALTLWREQDHIPLTLEGMAEASFHSGDVYPVEVAVDGRAFRDGTSDKWIGGSIVRFLFEKKPLRFRRDLRIPFSAPDRKNIWTLRARFEYC